MQPTQCERSRATLQWTQKMWWRQTNPLSHFIGNECAFREKTEKEKKKKLNERRKAKRLAGHITIHIMDAIDFDGQYSDTTLGQRSMAIGNISRKSIENMHKFINRIINFVCVLPTEPPAHRCRRTYSVASKIDKHQAC